MQLLSINNLPQMTVAGRATHRLFFTILLLSSIAFNAFAISPIDDLTTEEALLTAEYFVKSERLKEIRKETISLEAQIKSINSKVLPLEIEMRKLHLDYKRISVKKIENRSPSEVKLLSKLKYRQRILELKINVEGKLRENVKDKITTLHDRENRLQRVVKKLNRQLNGVRKEIAETQESKPPFIAIAKPPAEKKSQLKKVPKIAKASIKPPIKPTKPLPKKTSPSTGVTQAVAANKNKPKTKTKTKPISLPLIIPAAPKKPAVTLAELSAEELDKRKKRLDFLLLMENIPNSVKAVIRAKNRALNNISAEPYLGSSPKIELSFIEGQNKGKSEWAELNHLGNNQYMNTVSISSGFQQFHVAHLKFTKRIDAIYHGKKAIIIIDAIDKENPTFEIYPVALEKPEYFLY